MTRLLLGPRTGTKPTWVGQVEGPEVLCFGETAPIAFRPHEDTLEDVLGRVEGEIDALVLWEPQLSAAPRGWEQFKGPIYAVLGDWQFLCLVDSDLSWLNRFERIYVDAPGAAFLQSQGFLQAIPTAIYSYDSTRLSPIPAAERTLDVGYAGALVHAIHRSRSQVLRRVAGLADRYRIAIRDWNLGPDEYAAFLQQARVVVNHNYRGEMNIRCYETMAVEALLMVEEGNPDMAGRFEDGVHYVSYNDDNLEERLTYYLDHEAERAAIAHAGWERVQSETHRDHVQRIVSHVDEAFAQGVRDLQPAAASGYQTGLNLFVNPYKAWNEPRFEAVDASWRSAAQEDTSERAKALLGLGALFSRVGVRMAPDQTEDIRNAALAFYDHVIAEDPNAALAYYSRANLLVEMGSVAAAVDSYRQAIDILTVDTASGLQVLGPFHPYTYDEFWVHWMEAAIGGLRSGEGDLPRGRILIGRCWEGLGEVAMNQRDWSAATQAFVAATKFSPESASVWKSLGRVSAELGNWVSAGGAFKVAQETEPFDMQSWVFYCTALAKSANFAECVAQADDYLILLQALPDASATRDKLNTLRDGAAGLLARQRIERRVA